MTWRSEQSSARRGEPRQGTRVTGFDEQAGILVDANRILAARGVLDAYGHVSVRDSENPDRFLLARSMAPALVTVDDIQRYDLEGTTDGAARSYLERFIHSEIYRARPDVMSVVHSHSLSVVPFGIVGQPLRAVWHMAGFLGSEVPVFEIRDVVGDSSDMLISDPALGKALAATLGSGAVSLMRGHGSVVVGASLEMAVHRAVFTELNARVQLQAIQLGDFTPLTAAEAQASALANDSQVSRAWELWRQESS
jgi:HCOMODA/2-hydroxy-3-carboxy-muconic semialdehyde decarboxylase